MNEKEEEPKCPTAPRVTYGDVEATIVSEHYFTGAEGVEGAVAAMSSNSEAQVLFDVDLSPLKTLTLCVLVLKNGTKIVGVNYGSVSVENFDADKGRRAARKDAVEKIWPLLGYALRDRLSKGAA